MKVAGFGEILLRLSTKKGILISNANEFNINYGGGEANALISLSRFGIKTRAITKVSNDSIGDAIIRYLNENSVDTSFVTRGSKRTPIYFLEAGSGNRSSKVIYDRKDSNFSSITEEDINIEEVLKDIDIFHFSGVTLAISEEVRKLVLKIIRYCNKNNILVSYDSNYRAKMWTLESARIATKEILPYVNILSAGILDAENILNMGCDLSDEYEKLNYYYKEISKIRKMPGVMENILSNKDEEEELIKEKIINRGKNQYWYVAEENGKVIGLGILMNHGNLRKKHVGVITLMVNSDYQNKGVGSLLMDKLINLSESLNIIRLELCVFRDNYKAINLYKKFGFKEEGIKVKSALKNGEYIDEIMMVRISL